MACGLTHRPEPAVTRQHGEQQPWLERGVGHAETGQLANNGACCVIVAST